MQEIFCIVEGGTTHPFRRVRQALTGSVDLSITPSPWSNRYLMRFRLTRATVLAQTMLLRRLHVKYHRCIPPIEVRHPPPARTLPLTTPLPPRIVRFPFRPDRNPGGRRVWPATPRCAHGGSRQSCTIPDRVRICTGQAERVDDVRPVSRTPAPHVLHF